jgi:hypothetical protein
MGLPDRQNDVIHDPVTACPEQDRQIFRIGKSGTTVLAILLFINIKQIKMR